MLTQQRLEVALSLTIRFTHGWSGERLGQARDTYAASVRRECRSEVHLQLADVARPSIRGESARGLDLDPDLCREEAAEQQASSSMRSRNAGRRRDLRAWRTDLAKRRSATASSSER
jgi:hypothetical protein